MCPGLQVGAGRSWRGMLHALTAGRDGVCGGGFYSARKLGLLLIAQRMPRPHALVYFLQQMEVAGPTLLIFLLNFFQGMMG